MNANPKILKIWKAETLLTSALAESQAVLAFWPDMPNIA
jgi:hypothetical protein